MEDGGGAREINTVRDVGEREDCWTSGWGWCREERWRVLFENRRCAVLLCFPLRCRLAAIPPFSQKKRTYRQGGRSSLEREERRGGEGERDRAMEHLRSDGSPSTFFVVT